MYAFEAKAPQVEEGVWVADTAVLVGDVYVGQGSSFWFGAIARGDNAPITIGKGSNVQEAAVLHADPEFPLTIGSNVTVGHKAMLHGCAVGDGSLIGIGAVVLNGAVIGRNCLVAAGALVPEGRIYPDGTLILGVPAVAKRELWSDEITSLHASAEQYQKNAERFRLNLKLVS